MKTIRVSVREGIDSGALLAALEERFAVEEVDSALLVQLDDESERPELVSILASFGIAPKPPSERAKPPADSSPAPLPPPTQGRYLDFGRPAFLPLEGTRVRQIAHEKYGAPVGTLGTVGKSWMTPETNDRHFKCAYKEPFESFRGRGVVLVKWSDGGSRWCFPEDIETIPESPNTAR